jgi:predicted phosphoribosyltransferase
VDRSGLTAEARRFRDRVEAGRLLAERLRDYAGRDEVVVLGLPRGGVPVAYELSKALGAPLDVFVVRKLGLPGHEELAMGAIATGGVLVLDENLLRRLGVREEQLERTVAAEVEELRRREAAYRGDRGPPDLTGKTVILVDDGLATGSTMRAAAEAVRRYDPARIVVAVPVAAEETCDQFRDLVDEIKCAVTPHPFHAVGLWYQDFAPTTDEEVRELLARRAREE